MSQLVRQSHASTNQPLWTPFGSGGGGVTGPTGASGPTGSTGPTGGAGGSQIFVDLKSTGTYGGDGTTYVGVYKARELNSGFPALSNVSGTIYESTTIPNLRLDTGTNQFSIPAGTYIVSGSTPCLSVGRHRNQLYNVTDSNVVLLGQGTYENPGQYEEGSAMISGSFTLAATKTFEFQEQIESLPLSGIPATYALGIAMNMGDDEVYSLLSITKIA